MMTAPMALLAVVLLAVPSETARQGGKKQDHRAQQQSHTSNTTETATAIHEPVIQKAPPAEPCDDYPCHKQATATPWWQRFAGDPVAVLTALILLVYIGLFFLGLSQTKAVIRAADATALSANTSKRALEMVERADIMLTEVRLDNPNVPPPSSLSSSTDTPVAALRWDTRISVVFKNVGRSKAKHLTHLCRLRLVNYEDSHQDWMTNSLPYELAAGETAIANLKAVGDRLQPHVIDEINVGDKKLRLDCVVDYHDIFGNLHHTEVEGIYWPSRKTFHMSHSHELDYGPQDSGPYDLHGVSEG